MVLLAWSERVAILVFGMWIGQSTSAFLKNQEGDLVAGAQLSIVEEPQSVRVVEGASLDLNCEAFGTPVPTIVWLKNGKPIKPDAPQPNIQKQRQKKYDLLYSPVMAERIRNLGVRTFQMSTTSSKIHVPCATRDSQGKYTCVASNGKETITANATVTLADKSNVLWAGNGCPRKRTEEKLNESPAQIYMWTDSRMERPGVSVQLMCRATGNPIPKIVWYESTDIDDDSSLSLIMDDDPRYAVLANGDLLVKETPMDSPVSMFKCQAVNEHGQDTVTSMLLEIIDDTEQGEKQNNQTPNMEVGF